MSTQQEEEMFTEKQIQALRYNLDGSRVKTRQQGNINLSYLEGYDLIDTANTVFGFGNWSYSISSLEQVSEETNEKQNKVLAYKAVVKVIVQDLHHSKHTSREDCGFGTGIAKQYADAHESGAKEAVTDALKRALRTFGSQFGNALYDKQQRNVDHIPQVQDTASPSPPVNQSIRHANASSLQQLGLEVQEHNGELIVLGSTYGKQESLKKEGFRWDSRRKVWWQSSQKVA
ncbi:Rad52/Rad22 family DNA repair protein [Sulfuricurvum sp.]|uniref:Rad52/Rad22 family DNA repair protein n=1 Tax=Sulfuricurvum sp. TaxID=2025608 RepID=UPI0035625B57